MPVQRETTSSMSVLATEWRPSAPSVHCSDSTWTCSPACAASGSRKKPPRSEASASSTTRTRPESSGTSAGAPVSRSLTRLPASSIRSIALSGRKRSVM